MNDKQEPAPERSEDQPAPDAAPAETKADKPACAQSDGLGECTLVRAVSSVVAFAATCLIAATLGGLFAMLAKTIPTRGGSLIQGAVETGGQTLLRCWLAGMVSIVMTNSFLRGDRSVVVRRCGILGVVSGLLAITILSISLKAIEGDTAKAAAKAIPYIVAAGALLVTLAWRFAEDKAAKDTDDKPAEQADEADRQDKPAQE